MFSRKPKKYIVGTSLLSLFVDHFGELLEIGGSGQKNKKKKDF